MGRKRKLASTKEKINEDAVSASATTTKYEESFVSALKKNRTSEDEEKEEEKEDAIEVTVPGKKKKGKKKKRKKQKAEHVHDGGKQVVTPIKVKPHLIIFGQQYELTMRRRMRMPDVQQFVLHAVLGSSLQYRPNWCKLERQSHLSKTVFILLSAVGEDDYLSHRDCFSCITKEFPLIVPTKAFGPTFAIEYPHNSLLSVPLSQNEKKRRNEARVQQCPEGEHHNPETYLMTREQFKANDYPSMCYGEQPTDHTNECLQLSATAKSGSCSSPTRLFAIDCEMCKSAKGKELTRISVVDESYNVVYDTLVKPDQPIVDYLTSYSGITPEMLEGVTVKLEDVQHELQRILPYGAILVGHSFEFDFRALKVCYDRVIDTSIIYVDGRGPPHKPALRYLARAFLKKNIQQSSNGHCSIEDAKTCMELVKLKLENGPSFGIPKLERESLFEKLSRAEKQCSIIDSPGIVRVHSSGGHHTIACTSDAEIESCSASQIKKSDFTWIHLHGAEIFYKENNGEDEYAEARKSLKDILRELDRTVASIVQAVSEDSLVMVMLGNSDVTHVIRLQKNKDPMRDELKQAVDRAKKGLCFFKIT